MEPEEVEEEPFLEGLSKFINENKEFLLKLVGTWSRQTSWQLFGKLSVVLVVLVMSGVLSAVGRISGETLAGIIGVVLGYILGKGVL